MGKIGIDNTSYIARLEIGKKTSTEGLAIDETLRLLLPRGVNVGNESDYNTYIDGCKTVLPKPPVGIGEKGKYGKVVYPNFDKVKNAVHREWKEKMPKDKQYSSIVLRPKIDFSSEVLFGSYGGNIEAISTLVQENISKMSWFPKETQGNLQRREYYETKVKPLITYFISQRGDISSGVYEQFGEEERFILDSAKKVISSGKIKLVDIGNYKKIYNIMQVMVKDEEGKIIPITSFSLTDGREMGKGGNSYYLQDHIDISGVNPVDNNDFSTLLKTVKDVKTIKEDLSGGKEKIPNNSKIEKALRFYRVMYGVSGENNGVKRLQDMLISRGYVIKKDGKIGPKTINAIIEYQKSNNLVADGIAGGGTLLQMKLIEDKSKAKDFYKK